MTGTKLVTIEASERTSTGKSYNRKLRRAGKIPAVILEKGKSTSIELYPKWLPKAWQAEGRQFELKLGGQTRKVAIKELQVHPLKRTAVHVDLVYA